VKPVFNSIHSDIKNDNGQLEPKWKQLQYVTPHISPKALNETYNNGTTDIYHYAKTQYKENKEIKLTEKETR